MAVVVHSGHHLATLAQVMGKMIRIHTDTTERALNHVHLAHRDVVRLLHLKHHVAVMMSIDSEIEIERIVTRTSVMEEKTSILGAMSSANLEVGSHHRANRVITIRGVEEGVILAEAASSHGGLHPVRAREKYCMPTLIVRAHLRGLRAW
jgi:hypothetical protein